jgi:hypothetical protein
MGATNRLNRLVAFVHDHTTSDSRRERLRKLARPLYDRVCAGVHDDVTTEEARALFLQT